jgi:hypothetical protein
MILTTMDRPFKRTEHCELFGYEFFVNVSAPSLTNFGTQYFFNTLVLQAYQCDESIKYLVLATSLLDCQERGVLTRNKCQEYFQSHYSRALRNLSSRQDPDPAIVLMACLLLILCDEYNENRSGALQHMVAGRRILSGYAKKGAQYSDAIAELGLIFKRLESQTSELEGVALPKNARWDTPSLKSAKLRNESLSAKWDPPRPSLLHDGFHSLAAASHCLKYIVPACMAPANPDARLPISTFHSGGETTTRLNAWLVHFDALISSMTPHQAARQRADMHLLRTQFMCLCIMSRCDPYGREDAYDRYDKQFEHVLMKIAYTLEYNVAENEALKDRLLSPLFFVAMRYRAAAFRRRAIEYLRRCDWPGRRLATIAEQVVGLEESGDRDVVVCSDVPVSRRVRLLDVAFPDSTTMSSKKSKVGSRCAMSFAKSPYDGSNHGVHNFLWKDLPRDESVCESIRLLLARVLRFEIAVLGADV